MQKWKTGGQDVLRDALSFILNTSISCGPSAVPMEISGRQPEAGMWLDISIMWGSLVEAVQWEVRAQWLGPEGLDSVPNSALHPRSFTVLVFSSEKRR